MKFLGIDYGLKRTGLATGDSDSGLVLPFSQLDTTEFLRKFPEICEAESVEALVIGYPLNRSGEKTPMTQNVDDFIELLKKDFQGEIHPFNEFGSSKKADRYLRQSGKNRKKGKANRDEMAACVILQDFFSFQWKAGSGPCEPESNS